MRSYYVLALPFLFLPFAQCFSLPSDTADELARKKEIRRLLAIIGDEELAKNNRSKVVECILELGRLKAVEASPQLAEKLDFHASATGVLKQDEFPSPEESYPAVKALVEIGKGAAPAIINATASQDRSRVFLDNTRHTLIVIYGGKAPAKNALEKAAKEYPRGDKGSLEKANRIRRLAASFRVE